MPRPVPPDLTAIRLPRARFLTGHLWRIAGYATPMGALIRVLVCHPFRFVRKTLDESSTPLLRDMASDPGIPRRARQPSDLHTTILETYFFAPIDSGMKVEETPLFRRRLHEEPLSVLIAREFSLTEAEAVTLLDIAEQEVTL